MPTITAKTITSRASVLLQDTTNIRWPEAELLQWLNDGQREIVLYKPSAFSKTAVMQLVPGTKQNLPADGTTLIGITRNMGTTGTAPGNVIRMTTREVLDSQIPNWHTTAANATALHYTYSLAEPKTFYVYPPQPATGMNQVEVVYAGAPTDVGINDVIRLDDLYMTALINYVMYRAYSKDAEFAANVQLAAAYYQAFVGLVTGKAAGETSVANGA